MPYQEKTLKSLGEFGLIQRLSKKVFLEQSVIQGIGDDTAVLPFTKDKFLLFTTDLLCEDVHFTRKENPFLIGHKALACSLSDIGAMGGVPTFAVVSIGLPKSLSIGFVDKMYHGINTLAKKFKTSIVGGDTIKSDKLIINVALLGEVEKTKVVLRSGANIGDQVFVTGALGRSLKTKKHLSFTPRLKEARVLVTRFKPSAMIDISDGLAADLGHILEESKKSAVLDEVAIPKIKGASLDQALFDGEDFELVFTFSRKQASKIFMQKELKVFWIGEITKQGRGLSLRDLKGKIRNIKAKGYRHF
jgi:thiamine-monophosphate kinase